MSHQAAGGKVGEIMGFMCGNEWILLGAKCLNHRVLI